MCRSAALLGRQACYRDYGVANRWLWWIWDERMGASSNHDDPSAGSNVGQKLGIMHKPTPLLSWLRFWLTGSSEVCRRSHRHPPRLSPAPRPGRQSPRCSRSA